VEEFMCAARLNVLTVSERNAAYNVLAALLVDHAQNVARYVRVPLTAKFVCNFTREIAAIFDAAFPGYVRAGMAAIVVGRVEQ
jgi:hypothetical protein